MDDLQKVHNAVTVLPYLSVRIRPYPEGSLISPISPSPLQHTQVKGLGSPPGPFTFFEKESKQFLFLKEKEPKERSAKLRFASVFSGTGPRPVPLFLCRYSCENAVGVPCPRGTSPPETRRGNPPAVRTRGPASVRPLRKLMKVPCSS